MKGPKKPKRLLKLAVTPKAGTRVSKRANSRGYKGMVLRVHHHAQVLEPMLAHIASCIPTWDFAEWRTSETAQVFCTADGRYFRLEPILDKKGYAGIRLLSCSQLRGGTKLRLLEIFHDLRNGTKWESLTDFLTDTTKVAV
jgi:hypothetical protein